MDKKIYLIRHCKIDYCSKKRYIGITDLELSEEGKEQAAHLKEYFREVDIEKVYLSPLKRCIQTADIILESRKVEKIILEELKEINMGRWEGKLFEEIKNRFPEQYEERGIHIDTFVTPEGESFEQVQKRAMPAFEHIVENAAGNILIISHAGVNRVILSKLFDSALKDILKIKQPYGCINQLNWDITCHKWQWDKIELER